MRHFAAVCLILLWATMARATDYYVDSGVTTGTHVGTQANPACSIYNIWSAINTDLDAATNVTVYFSARNASSDTPDIYTGNSVGGCSGGGGSSGFIDMGQLSTSHAATLTFNGHSKYNTSDSSPSWTTYSGSSMAEMYSIFGQNAGGIHHSKYVIDGIRLRPLGTKAISICGDHVRVTNSDIAAGVGATDGLGILIVPTADSAHEGSGEACPIMTDIEIDHNLLHDTWSEQIYVGGGGCRHGDPTGLDDGSGATFNVTKAGGAYTAVTVNAAGSGYTVGQHLNVRGNLVGGADDSNDVQIVIVSLSGSGVATITWGGSAAAGSNSYTGQAATNNCQGFPSHSDIRIHDNEGYFTGYIGGENDGIDIKGGLRGMRVYGNYFHNFIYFNMIVSQGQSSADAAADNWFYNNRIDNNTPETAAIKFSNTWGTPRGDYLFNNLISNSHANYMMLNTDGVRVYACAAPFYFANNVLYNNSEAGFIVSDCDGGTFKNNAALANGTGFFATGTPTSTNNAYDAGWTLCTSCQSGLTSADFVNAAALNFNPAPGSTKLINTAADLTSLGISALDFDFAGTARPSGLPWDAGAYENSTTPCVATKVVFTSQPSDANLGASLGTVTVKIENASSSVCTDSSASVTLSRNSGSTAGTLSSATGLTFNVVAGVGTKTDLVVTGSTGTMAIDAASSGLTGATSNFVTISNVTAPVPGNSGIITTASIATTSLTLNWTKATDDVTPQANLVYKVYKSSSNNITSVNAMETNGTLLTTNTDINTYGVTGLTPAALTYFNVSVADGDGNKAAYAPVSATTTCGATKVVFTSQPSNAQLGSSLGTVTVKIENASSAVCTDSSASVTLSRNSGSTAGTLFSATGLTFNVVAGVGTKTDLVVTGTTGTMAIDAASSMLTGATSNFVTISSITTANAASCSKPDIDAAIATVPSGGTVIVLGAGTCTYTVPVVIPSSKGITLNGNGATINSMLQRVFTVGANASDGSRITGFTFNRTGKGGTTGQEPIGITGSPTSAVFRIDHNSFSEPLDVAIFVSTFGNPKGVIDHNTFTGGAGSAMIQVYGASGNVGWTDDVTPGSAAMPYIEDNTFTYSGNGGCCSYDYFGTTAVKSYGGSRFVARHNTFNMVQVQATGTVGQVGARWWEVYLNSFNTNYTQANQSFFIDLLAGSGVVWSNTHTGGNLAANGGSIRFSEPASGPWPAAYQVGSGINGQTARHSTCASGTLNQSPAYVWNNGTINIQTVNPEVKRSRDVFVSSTQPSTLLRKQLSTDTCSTTYVYTPYTYPYPGI